MSERYSKKICAKCAEVGFRFRGDRWLCVIHNRFDTMMNGARARGKTVPTFENLTVLADQLIANNMACPHCATTMDWAGRRGQLNRVSLQHDRSGLIRLICMLCNLQHDDMPGDSFYDLPLDHKFCPKCKTVKPLTEFPRWKVPGRNQWPPQCRICQKETSRIAWAKFSAKRRSKCT